MAKIKSKSQHVLIDTDRDEFIRLAKISGDSSSRLQDALVDHELEVLCRAALDKLEDSDIEAALSELKKEATPAYDNLLAMAEDCAQTVISEDGVHLLVLVPILAMSRFRIPLGQMTPELPEQLGRLYRDCFSTPQATVCVGNCLLCPENIPDRLVRIRELLHQFIECAGASTPVADITPLLTETPEPDFSDSRYIVISVTAADAQHLFADSKQSYETRAATLMEFCLQAHRLMESSMIGCTFEVQSPAAFFTAWRQSEISMRIYSLKSLIDYVGYMNYSPDQLIVTSAIFSRPTPSETEPNAEVRIGVSLKKAPDRVIAGVVWVCMDDSGEESQTFATDIVHTCGVHTVEALEQTFTMEWCDDCGAPLYANPSGLVCHIEMPEEVEENIQNILPTLH